MSTTPVAKSSTNETNQKLLEALIKQIPDKGLDWQKIADEMGSTPGAARERWRRYKIAQGINTSAANNVVRAEKASAKKGTPKRKADASGDDEDEEDAGPSERTPAKKSKTKGKGKGKEVSEDDEDEEAEETPSKKKTVAKKKATAPAPKPKKLVPKVESDEEENASEAETKIESDAEMKDIASTKGGEDEEEA